MLEHQMNVRTMNEQKKARNECMHEGLTAQCVITYA